MATLGTTIIRDQKDFPDSAAARADLPAAYAEYPYLGVWLQPGCPPEYAQYVFGTVDAAELVDGQWVKIQD